MSDPLCAGDISLQCLENVIRLFLGHGGKKTARCLRIKQKIADSQLCFACIDRVLRKRAVAIHAFGEDPDPRELQRLRNQPNAAHFNLRGDGGPAAHFIEMTKK